MKTRQLKEKKESRKAKTAKILASQPAHERVTAPESQEDIDLSQRNEIELKDVIGSL